MDLDMTLENLRPLMPRRKRKLFPLLIPAILAIGGDYCTGGTPPAEPAATSHQVPEELRDTPESTGGTYGARIKIEYTP